MKLEERPGGFVLYKEKTEVGCCQLTRTAAGADVACLTIVPEWRRKGYGSYLLKEILRRFGGYDRETATVFTAPLPAVPGEEAFWAKFGFREEAGRLCRRRTPDLTAVKFVQDFLAARLQNPQLLVDATCGNGGDTAFLCRLAGGTGRVLGFDIQPEAIASTRRNLAANGLSAELYCGSHADLLHDVQPGTADAVLSAILYSGRVIGSDEKTEILHWMRTLPLTRCTVLVCDFANWAETAPLPCFLLKK